MAQRVIYYVNTSTTSSSIIGLASHKQRILKNLRDDHSMCSIDTISTTQQVHEFFDKWMQLQYVVLDPETPECIV